MPPVLEEDDSKKKEHLVANEETDDNSSGSTNSIGIEVTPPQTIDNEDEEQQKQGVWGWLKFLWSKISNSRVYKVLTSSGFTRAGSLLYSAISITLASLMVVGVTLGIASSLIFAPYITIPIAVITITSVVIAAAIDTYYTRTTRALYRENKYLLRHKLSKHVTNNLLKTYPKLRTALDGLILSINKKEGLQPRLKKVFRSKTGSRTGAAGYAILSGFFPIVTSIISGMSRIDPLSILSIIKDVGVGILAIVGIGGDAYAKVSLSDKRRELREHIDKLRENVDTPEYENLAGLQQQAREQKIQALALQKITSDPDFEKWDEKTTKEKFIEARTEVERREKVVKKASAFKDVGKAFLAAHNPFSKYTDPELLSTQFSDKELVAFKLERESIPKEVRQELDSIASQVKDSSQKLQQHKKTQKTQKPPATNLGL